MLPLTEVDNPALVHDYQSKGLSVNVYLKDIRFDKNGWPSQSSLYFCDREGTVRVLPREMNEDFVSPEPLR